MKSVFLIYPE
ncbi:hypothetical protein Zm00014a_035897 [Zea mays]|uniref:Uncharacterized protein n=1 Tax=Zea mays TaxID=4577 RepID=A0A3L6EGN3_MAIZE|nr:hypothetical protein Zm00014a_035897 [Zea mays]